MIVLDASVVVELLTGGPLAEPPRRELAAAAESVLVPHLLDIEAVSAIRNLVAGRRLDPYRSRQLLSGLERLPAQRLPHTPLLPRIWEPRRNFTVYGAAYIALAEATGEVLYTCDEKLSKGHRARVVLFPA